MQAVIPSGACRTVSAQPFIGRRRVCRLPFSRSLCFRAVSAAVKEKTELFSDLELACKEFKRAPPSEKYEYTADIMTAMTALREAGAINKWGAATFGLERRIVFQGELRKVGVKTPGAIAVPTVRNERAFLVTVVGTTSVLAVAAGQLPGDWGFFSAYLIGGISIAVLAIGSTAPGLLSFFINKFSTIFPDYYERVLGHEAAHFLAGYLLGVPVSAYSLDIGKAHTDFAESKLQQRLIERQLTDEEVNQLAVISMAGIAGEARKYEEIQGQTADLSDLQRILNRSQNKLSDAQQQNMTRWAVYNACTLLQEYEKEYQALQDAMKQGKSIPECVTAIESA